MSDLVGNPEDRFSHVAAQMAHNTCNKIGQMKFLMGSLLFICKFPETQQNYLSRDARKLAFGAYDQVQHKPACTVIEVD